MGFSLALSGGGLLGAAHLGVLAALEEAGLHADAVAGTSAGGLVAGLLALHVPVDRIHELGQRVTKSPWDYFSLNLEGLVHAVWPNGTLPATGLVEPSGFLKALLALAPWAKSTGDWRIPCVVTAVDVARLEAVAFSGQAVLPPSARWTVTVDAPLGLALHATMALPGLFSAARTPSSVLVDGGIADTLPADWAYALCRQPVLAIDVAQGIPKSAAHIGIAEVVARAETYATETLSQLRDAKLPIFTVAPDTRGVPFFGFSDYERLVQVGYAAMTTALPAFTAFLRRESLS